MTAYDMRISDWSSDVCSSDLPGSAGGAALGFATQVFQLRSIDARKAAETIKPLVGRGGVVAATPGGNSLLVADYADNLRRIRALVAEIDDPSASVDTVTLRNSSAREIAATVNGLFAPPGSDGDRKSVVSGKRVSGRVDLGGRRRIKKK